LKRRLERLGYVVSIEPKAMVEPAVQPDDTQVQSAA
jgi:hypothetical protein